MLLCFPQMYLRFNYSLIRFQDTEFLYSGLFQLAQNMVHGRVQLWNSYDQMPLAYFYLTGMMTYAHLLSAALFVATQGLAQDSGRYFYEISILVFNLIPTVVRTIGLYLLVRLFSSHSPTILLSTALGSSIFNPQFHLGLNCTPIYSLMPLAMFYCLRFVDDFRLRDFLLGFLVVTVCVATNPLVGLGYFYQGLHFFLLSAVCWAVLRRRSDRQAGQVNGIAPWTSGRLVAFARNAVLRIRNRDVYVPAVCVLLLSGLIMLPWIWLLLETYPDYELAHTTSRFAHPFTVLGYFKREHLGADPWQFFTRQLDFSSNQWIYQWVFVGWTCLILSVCGAVLAKDCRKYIFLATIVFFWLIQFPRDPASVFSVAHWINALTNPFNSVLRSAHMTGGFLLPTMLIPLFAMGLDRVRLLLATPKEPVEPSRVVLVLLLIVFIIVAALVPMEPWEMTTIKEGPRYIAAVGLLGILLVGSLLLRRLRAVRLLRWLVFFGFSLVLLADLWASAKYFSQMAKQMQMMPHSIVGIPFSVNPVSLDFQNPLVTPVRAHYANVYIGQVEPFAITDPNNMQGLFYRYTNMQKFSLQPSNYKPRHRSYAILANDRFLQEYLERDSRISFFADAAVRFKAGIVEKLLEAGLDRRIVAIESADAPLVGSISELRHMIGKAPIRVEREVSASFKLADAKEVRSDSASLRRHVFWLPPDFPRALASAVFTDDLYDMEVRLGGVRLVPAQGWLARPMQYDLQNIRAGTLQISLASDSVQAPDTALSLRYRVSTPLNALTARHVEPDSMEFSVNAPRASWLVVHAPYDPNWKFFLNGSMQPAFRANGAFVSLQVPAGESLLRLEYKSGSPLRFFIPASLLIGLIVMVATILYALRALSIDAERAITRKSA